MKQLLVALTVLATTFANAQSPVGIFQTAADIGNPKNPGSTQFDATSQSYAIKGAGYNVWFNRDEFHYAYNKIKGDFILTANFELKGQGKHAHRKVGWMVRNSAEPESSHTSAVIHGDGLTRSGRSNRFSQNKNRCHPARTRRQEPDHARRGVGRTVANRRFT
jgi:TolB protein